MASRKTWIWIIVSVIGFCLLVLFAIAGVGIYFVSHHISARHVASEEALKTFDAVRAQYKGRAPILEVDASEHPSIPRPLSEIATSTVKPVNLEVLVFNPSDEQLVRVDVPFWILSLSRNKINLGSRSGFDLDRLNLDVPELERIGPGLVLDYHAPSGERVLIWTQ